MKPNLKFFGLYLALINLLLLCSGFWLIIMLVTFLFPYKAHRMNSGGATANIMFVMSRNNGGESVIILNRASLPLSLYRPAISDTVIKSTDGMSYVAHRFSSKPQIVITGTDFEKKMKWFFGLLNFSLGLSYFLFFYIIRKILVSLREGTPFRMANVRNLGTMASILFCLPVIQYILDQSIHNALKSTFGIIGYPGGPLPDKSILLYLVSGVLLSTLAYVLKQGVIMKDEQDLTI